MTDPARFHPGTWAILAGRDHGEGAALNVPIVPASNFVHGGARGYARGDGTPTWEALEDVAGGLERGRAIAFASGMAAVAAVFDLLPIGARVVLPSDGYQGAAQLTERGVQLGRWSLDSVDVDDTRGWIEAAATADLLWIESPSNPLLLVADLPMICAAARKPGGILAVDNTFATPLNQQPLLMGADIVVHSATKFIGGHSDLLAGIAVTQRDDLHRELARARELTGATPGALECYLAVRGCRTLGVRVAAGQASAAEIARRLIDHEEVEVVRYPGLTTHPTHDVAARVLNGFGSIVSFDVSGGAERADAICRRLDVIHHATSLGSVESTIERRAAVHGQEHLPAGLLRLSVGCEDVSDLWRDIADALDATRR